MLIKMKVKTKIVHPFEIFYNIMKPLPMFFLEKHSLPSQMDFQFVSFIALEFRKFEIRNKLLNSQGRLM